VKVHLLDGTYELFRQHYGAARARPEADEVAATRGVLRDVVSMLSAGATHLGVATDHVIESFRNDLWAGYKSSAGVPEELLRQFPLLEAVLESLGVKVWAMVELEADDALASAAWVAAGDAGVEQVLVCTPDKDLAQCVSDDRVVQVDRRTGELRDEQGVWDRFGVAPRSIPDWLALVGDSADGFPGLAGWGKRSASAVLSHYGSLDEVPEEVSEWDPAVVRSVRGAARLASVLHQDMELAKLFRDLATLRVEPDVVGAVADLEWRGPTPVFERVCEELGEVALLERVSKMASGR
jgi:5'-3' exonuclease